MRSEERAQNDGRLDGFPRTALGRAGVDPINPGGILALRDSDTKVLRAKKKVKEKSTPKGDPSTWRLAGIAVDAQGKLVRGANVVATDPNEERYETKTDAYGKFKLSVPAPKFDDGNDGIHLTIADTTKTMFWGNVYFEKKPDEQEKVRAVLEPTRALRVEVVDAQGKAVPGAHVIVSDNFVRSLDEVTGEDGTVRGKILENKTNTTVFAWKSGEGFDFFSTHRQQEQRILLPGLNIELPGIALVEVPPQVTLTLRGARNVRIKVVDGRDDPVPGINVQPMGISLAGNPGIPGSLSGTPFGFRTGSDGIVVFDWIPREAAPYRPGYTAPYRYEEAILGRIPSQSMEGRIVFAASPSVEFSHPAPLMLRNRDRGGEYTLTMTRKAKISGRVLLPDGKPARQINVTACGRGLSSQLASGSATTDSAGRFTMSVDSHKAYVVGVEDKRWAGSLVGIVVMEGKTAKDVELKVVEGTVVTGRVTSGPNQAPVSKTQLTLKLDGGNIPQEMESLRKNGDTAQYVMQWWSNALTDAQGQFRFVVAPGKYALGGLLQAPDVSFEVSSEKKVVHNFELPSADGFPFTVSVRDKLSGMPVIDAKCNATYASRYVSSAEWRGVQEGGFHRGKRESQPLVIHASAPHRKLGIVIRSKAHQQDATCDLCPTANVRGRLIDPDGKPMSGAYLQYGVKVTMDEIGAPFIVAFADYVKTNADGKYEISGIAAGAEWIITYDHPENNRWSEVGKVTVDKNLEIDLGETRLVRTP